MRTCASCGGANSDSSRFCVECGARLTPSCPQCGAELPGSVRFCPSCGATIGAAAAGEEQRKVVSVLFADLVGFTAQSQDADPEDVRESLRGYHATVKETIERFGGVVEKFIGDAVMAVFGAPISRGDDAERAVRAAMEIPRAIEELNRSVPELNLAVRVAVNTGETMVAVSARFGEGEAMVAGDVVNTASRLQSAAPEGGVLVGEGTYRASRRAIRYEPTEPILAKGKRDPVPAWVPVESLPSAAGRFEAPMLGRERELELLHGVWDRAVNERKPHIVTMLGDPGIGKSRLAEEFAERLEEMGGRAFSVRELPYAQSSGYEGFGQLVKAVAGIFETDAAESSRHKLESALRRLDVSDADLAQALSVFAGSGKAPAEDRRALFDAARRFVEALARERPTLLVFEDIHWAHAGSLDLIQFLADRTREAPIVFAALARPELLDTRPDWGGGLTASATIRLEPLSADDVHVLTGLLLTGLPKRVSARIEATSGGNPLFVEELAWWVAEVGVEDQALPTTMRAMIAARLDALPPGERDVLYDASVIGKVFWLGALRWLRPDAEDVEEVLDSLEARDLIRAESGSRLEGDREFAFRHILIRDAAYATLPRGGRRARHEAVARFIEGGLQNPDAVAAILAHHWREAGDPSRAVDWLLIAAAQAEKSWATNEAVQLYDEAVTLVPKEEEARRRTIGTKRAVAALRFQHYVNDLPGGGPEGEQSATR